MQYKYINGRAKCLQVVCNTNGRAKCLDVVCNINI